MRINESTCKESSSLIDLFAGGDLHPTQAAPLRLHLEGCRACRERYESARSALLHVRALAGQALIDEVPAANDPEFWDAMTESIMARLSRFSARNTPTDKLLWFGTGFAAAAAVLLLVWLSGALPRSPLTPLGPETDGVAELYPGPRGNLTPVTGPLERWAALPLDAPEPTSEEGVFWPELPLEFYLRGMRRPGLAPVVPAGGQANF